MDTRHLQRLAATLVLSGGLAPLASATPTTVNFENYPSTGVHALVSSGGFDFSAVSPSTIAIAANGSNCSPNCAANGTSALVVGAPNLNPPTTAPLTMVSTSGFAFRLLGLDFAELSNSSAGGWSASTIVMTGLLVGGGTVTQTLTIDGLNDGPGGAADFETATLDGVWSTSELSSLLFEGFIGNEGNHGFQLDNIAVDVLREQTVPEPASLALSAMALFAATLAGRRRTRQRALA